MSLAKICLRFVRRELIAVAALIFCAAVVFLTPSYAQTYTVLHNFSGGADGSYPNAGLTLNGTANLFGAAGENTIFRLRLMNGIWVFMPIYQFSGDDGGFLSGRLTVGPGGALYGASSFGGVPDCRDGAGCGLILSLRPPRTVCKTTACDWSQSTIYEFNPLNRFGDGYGPNGGLVFDGSGNIYGTTQTGGSANAGTVFMASPAQGGGWTETSLYEFQYSADGAEPNGNLVIDHSGNLIGTAATGGMGDNRCIGDFCGVVFQMTHTSSGWVQSILHTFTYSDGANPSGGLISDAAGNLYGNTSHGGTNGGGTVYELSPSNGGYTFHVLYNFTGSASQSGPAGILALDSSGNLYGATYSEGAVGQGNIFKLTHSGNQWIYSNLHDFAGGADGSGPADGPTLDPSSNLYGTATFGGTSNNCPSGCGVVWEIRP